MARTAAIDSAEAAGTRSTRCSSNNNSIVSARTGSGPGVRRVRHRGSRPDRDQADHGLLADGPRTQVVGESLVLDGFHASSSA
jgi:hypothetical protein